ncbi:MAG: bacteriorhodopsin-like [Pseudomonadota bacterium]|nr:bacteriorhodopsin-like [Pseudomonadota bacterium]
MYLQVDDLVGISFFVTSMALLASTAFFYMERGDVIKAWRTSITVACLVTGIAFVHYIYMRGVWLDTTSTPIVLRYVDWLITVPLQIVEFYLILTAVGYRSVGLFWKLLIASVVMLVTGYIGESGLGDAWLYFTIGMVAWLYILYELFFGEVSRAQLNQKKASCNLALNCLKWIVTVGWAIYPLGYVYGYLLPSISINALNIIYNLADFVNKIAFGLVIWTAARMDTPLTEK